MGISICACKQSSLLAITHGMKARAALKRAPAMTGTQHLSEQEENENAGFTTGGYD
jgi:hypothetical protein